MSQANNLELYKSYVISGSPGRNLSKNKTFLHSNASSPSFLPNIFLGLVTNAFCQKMNTQRTKKKNWNSPDVPFRINYVLSELWKGLRGEKKREEWLWMNAYHMIGTRRNGKVYVCVCAFTGTKGNLIKITFTFAVQHQYWKIFWTKCSSQTLRGSWCKPSEVVLKIMKRLFRHNLPYANNFISSLYAYNEKKTFCWNLKNWIKQNWVKPNYSFLSFWWGVAKCI